MKSLFMTGWTKRYYYLVEKLSKELDVCGIAIQIKKRISGFYCHNNGIRKAVL